MFKKKVFLLKQKINDAWKARLITLSILAFFASIASFLRPFLFGYDSYASILCQGGIDCDRLGFQPLMLQVLHFLPFNPLLLNLIFWFVCFATFLALFLIIQHFTKDERRTWIVLLVLISFCPFFIFHLHEWENELFAYPLLFFALYFVLKEKIIPALGFVALAGLFWAGSAFVLVPWGIAFVEGWMVIPFVGAYFVFRKHFIEFLFPTSISESVFGWGLLDLFILVGVLPFCLAFNAGEGFILLGFLLALVFGMLQGKLIIVLVPFVVLGLVKVLEVLEKQNISTNMLIPLSFFMLLCFSIAFYNAEPTINQMKMVSDSVIIQKDTNLPLYNDWSYGYWIQYKGLDNNFKGSPPNPDYNSIKKPFLALTDHNLSYLNCKVIKSNEIRLKLWNC